TRSKRDWSTDVCSSDLITKDKLATEHALRKSGINTTESINFFENQYEEAKDYVSQSDESFVFKPRNLNGGRGITLEVDSNNFDQAWEFALKATKELKKEFNLIDRKSVV